jgi:uracil-DNA glycosylase
MKPGWEKYITNVLPVPDSDNLCPSADLVYRAFSFFEPQETRVVILGQDPYHTLGKASGLAFGYNKDYHGPVDSSLANIKKAVHETTGQILEDLTLESWARQGVLLLNTRLTTLAGKPLQHRTEWRDIMINFIDKFSRDQPNLTWLCWGNEAQEYYANHAFGAGSVWSTSHPCRFSAHRGFLTCDQFRVLSDNLGIAWGNKTKGDTK